MQVDATRAAAPGGTSKAVLALTLNAFIWGVSWWPLRQLQGHGLHPLWTTALVYAVVVAGFMWVIQRWHKSNTVKYKEQVDHLLNIARSDKSH